jgi:diguanylate cyclase (GGDEF)-like protein
LKEEFSRAIRHNEPISLAFIDIDDFKKINDEYGHNVGDSALKQIGEVLKRAARESDLPARCGGDEFALLLPNTDADGGLMMAKRIFELINDHEFNGIKGLKISTSIGVATAVDNNVQGFEDLVKLADDAMYASKKQGKGKVVMAQKLRRQTIPFKYVGS